MKAKIDLEKFICSYVKWNNIQDALKDQGLKCWNGEIVEIQQKSADERIRKALLEMVHDTTGDELLIDYDVHKEDAIAWLEKQGEKEEVDANETNSKHQDIMQMLQSIYEVLVSINNKNAPAQIVPYTPPPLEPFYDTSKPYCNTTNKIEDNERPEESL